MKKPVSREVSVLRKQLRKAKMDYLMNGEPELAMQIIAIKQDLNVEYGKER